MKNISKGEWVLWLLTTGLLSGAGFFSIYWGYLVACMVAYAFLVCTFSLMHRIKADEDAMNRIHAQHRLIDTKQRMISAQKRERSRIYSKRYRDKLRSKK